MDACSNRRAILDEDPRNGFGLTLSELARQWRLFLDQRVEPYGLTSVRCSILATLNFEGPRSQVELARHLGVKAPSMVRQIDKLEKDGLIKRTVHPEDRRVKVVALAEGAQATCTHIREQVLASRNDIFAGLSSEEVKTAHLVLLAMRDNIMRIHGGVLPEMEPEEE